MAISDVGCGRNFVERVLSRRDPRCGYINGGKSFIPPNKQIIIPTRIIDQSNVKEFQTQMRDLLRSK